ncbi:MAG: hypothetical protein FD123_1248 [Bacteroidetes bacterium]|nr:MAG: hypothetical protein FD123_1248 [Bacteroidota bacterium]
MRIIVIERQAIPRFSLCRLLRKLGYDIAWEGNSWDEVLPVLLPGELDADLVICEISGTPENFFASALFGLVQKQKLPVICATTCHPEILKDYPAKLAWFVSKPYGMPEIMRAIKQIPAKKVH